MLRIQELIYSIKPDVIVETGVAHGGSLVFYASLCKTMERGRVIGVDVEIRSHNRKAIEAHQLFPFITLIEGSSINEAIVNEVKAQVRPEEPRTIIDTGVGSSLPVRGANTPFIALEDGSR